MNSETVSKRKRVDFSKDEITILEEAYQSGLQTIDKKFQKDIKSLSDKLNICELRIKYWIGNRRKKEERATGKKIYKKKKSQRFPSAYNLFATSIKRGETSGATYLKSLAADWSQISPEEKKIYKEKAEEFKKDPQKHLDRNECIKAQLDKIKSAAVVLDSLGYTIGGFGIDTETESDKNSFHFVTSKSKTFFTCGLLEKFQSQVMGTTEIVVGHKDDDLKKLRKKLRKHWNKCWKKSTGLSSLIPYSDIKDGVLMVNVDGLPQDLSFRNPNYYSVANLKRLLKLPVSFQITRHINSSEDKGKAELPKEIPVEVEGISIPMEVEGISIPDNTSIEKLEDHIGRDINQLLDQVSQNEPEGSEHSGGNKKQRRTKTLYTRYSRKNNKKAKKGVFTDDQSDKRDSKAYRIEKILKKNKNKLLVRWADDKTESWIFADDMVTDENELSTL